MVIARQHLACRPAPRQQVPRELRLAIAPAAVNMYEQHWTRINNYVTLCNRTIMRGLGVGARGDPLFLSFVFVALCLSLFLSLSRSLARSMYTYVVASCVAVLVYDVVTTDGVVISAHAS